MSNALAGMVISTTGTLSVPATDFFKLVKLHGGEVAYMLSNKTTHLVTNRENVASGGDFKVKTAFKRGVKGAVVTEEFITNSIHAGHPIDVEPFLLREDTNQSKTEYFSYLQDFVGEEELAARRKKEESEKLEREERQKRVEGAATTTGRKPRQVPTRPPPSTRAIAVDADNAPFFPDTFDLIYYATLQWTDMKENHNKYYALEYHIGTDKGRKYYRLYTHYGRTDDLITNPKAGRRETRHYNNEDDAENAFAAIYQEKTKQKGYRPVDLVFSNIGSMYNASLNEFNISFASALKKLGEISTPPVVPSSSSQPSSSPSASSNLEAEVETLVQRLYDESVSALSSSLGSAKITSKGIETPLGVVTLKQIQRGEEILHDLYDLFQKGNRGIDRDRIERLSNEFYTCIPQSLGRSKAAIQSAIMSNMADFTAKEELLQLMKDMLSITVESQQLVASDTFLKYAALKNTITLLKKTDPDYSEIYNSIVSQQVGPRRIKILNLFNVCREAEQSNFRTQLHNQRLLYHGSRAANFVGLLSRGVLMPKLIVAMGGKRRDAGLLGNGIYFGDSPTTAAQYTTATTSDGSRRFMLICLVALGESMQFDKVAYGLTEPPSGYQSVHGVSNKPERPSDFKDDEFVIFNPNQQKQTYLLEFEVVDEFEASRPMNASSLPSTASTSSSSTSKKSSLTTSTTAQLLEQAKQPKASTYSSGLLDNSALRLDPDMFKFSTEAPSTKPSLLSSDKVPIFSANSGHENERESMLSSSGLRAPIRSYRDDVGDAPDAARSAFKSSASNPVSVRDVVGPYAFVKLRSAIGRVNARAKKDEDAIRQLFVSDKTSFKLSDPHVLCVDVYKHRDQFLYQPESVDDERIPKLLCKFRTAGLSDYSVVPQDVFLERFEEFTGGVFKGLNWNNMVIAGGSVLGCMMNISENQREIAFRDSDIDIFFYGLTPEEATAKAEEIFFKVQSNTNASGEVVRTQHAITIVGQYPIRHVQIVLRMYTSPAEVLCGFDIDCCAVGFDGQSVWALPRAVRALTKRYNLVDMSRRSLTYESRLYKYAKRGFAVGVPGLLRHLIPATLYEKRPWEVSGLAKLLLFEHALTNPEQRYGPWKPQELGHRLKVYSRDAFSEDRINSFNQLNEAVQNATLDEDEDSPAPKSDYSTLFFPWGPQWYTTSIVREILHRDKATWSTTGSHIALVGIHSVLTGTPHWVKPEYSPPHLLQPVPAVSNAVSGELVNSWLTENPGRQLLTGSFHPVDNDQWFSQGLVDEGSMDDFAMTLADCCFGDNASLLRTLLRRNRNIDLNQVDRFKSLRSAINHAALHGSVDCAKELIHLGANVNGVDTESGLSTIHLAAYSDRAKLVEALIRAGADVNARSVKQGWTPLHLASYYGHREVVKVLVGNSDINIEAVDHHGRSALFLAALGGNTEVVKILLEVDQEANPSDFSGLKAIPAALARGNISAAALIVKKLNQNPKSYIAYERPRMILSEVEGGDAPLLSALSKGDIPSVNQLIENKENIHDVDSSGSTALHVAAARSSAVLNKIVYEVAPTLINKRDVTGQTPLHVAVRSFNEEAVSILLKRTSDKGASYLMTSEQPEDSFPLELDSVNELGQSPLLYVILLQATFNFPDNYDDLDGLPLAHMKKQLDIMKNSLLSAGAARPHLNYFTQLPNSARSPFIGEETPSYSLSTKQSSTSLEQELEAQRESERDVEVQQGILESIQQLKQRTESVEVPDVITDTNPPRKRQRTEDSVIYRSHSGYSETTAASLFSPLPQTSTSSAASSLSSFAAALQPAHDAGDTSYLNQIDPDNKSRFELPSIPAEPNYSSSPNAHIRAQRMEQIAAGFKSNKSKEELSPLASSLHLIASVRTEGLISLEEYSALKVLALSGNPAFNAVIASFNVLSDRTELIDSFHKLSHLSYE